MITNANAVVVGVVVVGGCVKFADYVVVGHIAGVFDVRVEIVHFVVVVVEVEVVVVSFERVLIAVIISVVVADSSGRVGVNGHKSGHATGAANARSGHA